MKKVLLFFAALACVISVQATVVSVSKWKINHSQIFLLGEKHKDSFITDGQCAVLKDFVNKWDRSEIDTSLLVELRDEESRQGMNYDGLLGRIDRFIQSGKNKWTSVTSINADIRSDSLVSSLLFDQDVLEVVYEYGKIGFYDWKYQDVLSAVFSQYVDEPDDVPDMISQLLIENDGRAALKELYAHLDEDMKPVIGETNSVEFFNFTVSNLIKKMKVMQQDARNLFGASSYEVGILNAYAKRSIEGAQELLSVIDRYKESNTQYFGDFGLKRMQQENNFNVFSDQFNVEPLIDDYANFGFLYYLFTALRNESSRIVVYAGNVHIEAIAEVMNILVQKDKARYLDSVHNDNGVLCHFIERVFESR